MAAVPNTFAITYGGLTVGGASSTLELHGPYVIERSHSRLRLVFDVVVVGESYEQLQSLSDSVETTFSSRDQSVEIDIGGSVWTYTAGETILNSVSTCQKTGNRETDRGYSRSYACVVEGELPATDQDGLRELEVHTDYSASRQKTVSMRGLYTSIGTDSATETYAAEFDTRAGAILTTIDNVATWELVHEEHTQDRNDSTATFMRQYLQLLADQSTGVLDDEEIRDHRVSFVDLSQHPGDAQASIHRLRRVLARYDCAVDVDETTDVNTVAREKVLPHLIGLFSSNFSPSVFGIEEFSSGLDKTGSRVSLNVTFVYQKSGGSDVVAVTESYTIRETETLDRTPVHNGSPFAAYVDHGWCTRERVYTRNATVIGEQPPTSRIAVSMQARQARRTGLPPLGPSTGPGGDSLAGWTTVQNTSQSTTSWIGDPDFGQLRLTMISETLVQQYNEVPT